MPPPLQLVFVHVVHNVHSVHHVHNVHSAHPVHVQHQTANRKKAFVSSTFKDLQKHRSAVLQALRKAGFAVDPMEEWTSDSDRPKTLSVDRVDGCDLCILLVAFRRGHVPLGEELSVTQMEYQRAVAQGIDVLAFLLDEQAPWPRQWDELDEDPLVRPWRA